EESFGPMGVGKLHAASKTMARLERKILPDCVLTTSGPPYWRSRSPHLVGFNLPLYIYPESPFLHNLSLVRRLKIEARARAHKALFRRQADALIVQTDDVNKRVRNWLGTDEVFTVTNTHSSFYLNPPQAPRRLPERQPGVFRLLTVTSYYAHKNLEIIPQIIPFLQDRISSPIEFVLTLTPDEYRARISPSIPPEVNLVGAVPPAECPALYGECDAMFLPTLAECFSASYAEAMVMEKPIVTTDLGFARSICGPAAVYFAPANPKAAAEAIAQLASSTTSQSRLRKAGRLRLQSFDTAVSRATKILKLCEKLADKKIPQ
ncbi:MAG: glycosyltransferase, partial [Gammaproteobacteria bacterium]|nr:glycosyltransferase [Gammaproteobacteria bacterium]